MAESRSRGKWVFGGTRCAFGRTPGSGVDAFRTGMKQAPGTVAVSKCEKRRGKAQANPRRWMTYIASQVLPREGTRPARCRPGPLTRRTIRLWRRV